MRTATTAHAPRTTSSSAGSSGLPAGLPVGIAVRDAWRRDVVDLVDQLGLQEVGATPETRVAGLAPAVMLVDTGTADAVDGPRVLLVGAQDDPLVVARSAAGADAVLAWPANRAELTAAVLQGLRRPPTRAGSRDLVRVGGAAGGVGTSVVAATVAGHVAWSGRRVVLVTAAAEATSRPATDSGVDLIGHDDGLDLLVRQRARPVAGVPGMRRLTVARVPDADARPVLSDGSVLVVDAGRDVDVDVLVGRRDPALLHALGRSPARLVAVRDVGGVPLRSVQRRLGRRRLVVLREQHRVAAVDAAGRLPADLPGRWVAELAVAARLLATAAVRA